MKNKLNKYRSDGTLYPDNDQGFLEWAWDIKDPSKKIVKQERVGKFFISTVWIGLDHNYCFHSATNCGCKPLIFESIVFDKKFLGDEIEEMVRYSSLDDALSGHAKLVEKFRNKRKR